MSETSQILNLPYIQPAQAQKHVTHNEALRILDAIVQLSVVDADRTVPPAAPQPGDRHIVPPGATGDWAGHDGEIALFDFSAWVFFAPKPGWQAHVAALGGILIFDGAAWEPLPINLTADDLQNLELLGVNAAADTDNRLSVASDATLLSHDGSDHQLKINKAASGDTASLLFQTGFSGHAELGLAGDDAFSVKVSSDGAAWTTALTVDPTTGTLSGAAVQQSAADVTPGRLMRAEHGVLRTDILGTVAQSGGAPTGALFERASTPNGDYVRTADGTQICSITTTLDYDTFFRLRKDWTYPLPFAIGSTVSVNVSVASELDATPSPRSFGFFGARQTSGLAHQSCSLRLYIDATSADDFEPTDQITVYATAIGRWF